MRRIRRTFHIAQHFALNHATLRKYFGSPFCNVIIGVGSFLFYVSQCVRWQRWHHSCFHCRNGEYKFHYYLIFKSFKPRYIQILKQKQYLLLLSWSGETRNREWEMGNGKWEMGSGKLSKPGILEREMGPREVRNGT